MRLYSDVVEVQFPGSVLLNSAARAVFGKTDFGFRMFDLCVLGTMLAAMAAICRREGKWFAGVFGFAYFLWTHTGQEVSIADIGERDFLMAAMTIGAGVFRLEGCARPRDEVDGGVWPAGGFRGDDEAERTCVFTVAAALFSRSEVSLPALARVRHCGSQRVPLRRSRSWASICCGTMRCWRFFSTERRLLPLYLNLRPMPWAICSRTSTTLRGLCRCWWRRALGCWCWRRKYAAATSSRCFCWACCAGR